MILLRASVTLSVLLAATPLAAQQWWSAYRVGDRVMFSVSGNAGDFQPCVVAEAATDDSPMRVSCQAFRQWAAGKYIVYSRSYLRAAGAPAATATNARPGSAPRLAPASVRATATATGGALKPGEYVCYGSGGRILAGLGFKLLPGGRYTDLEGGNAGRIAVSAGQISFVGGHLGGRTARRLGGNSFAFGQTECEPY